VGLPNEPNFPVRKLARSSSCKGRNLSAAEENEPIRWPVQRAKQVQEGGLARFRTPRSGLSVPLARFEVQTLEHHQLRHRPSGDFLLRSTARMRHLAASKSPIHLR